MIGFGVDGEVMGGSFGGNIADAMAGTQGAMEGATAYGGLGEVSDGPGLSKAQTNAAPTINIVQDEPIAPQISLYTQALKSFMSMMPEQMRAPMHGVMGLPGYQGLTDNLGYDPGLAQAFGAKSGVPYGFDEAMQNVPTVGSGAHLGLATNIANVGGQNVHMGPGFMMNENNYPGYGINHVTGEGFADPGDPYIRKQRGSEIAGMIGP